MIINDYAKDYRINFKYSGHTTMCTIECVRHDGVFKTDGQVIGTGQTSCHKNDRFVKAVGRKLALKRAMQDSDLSKDERQFLWLKYFQMTNTR